MSELILELWNSLVQSMNANHCVTIYGSDNDTEMKGLNCLRRPAENSACSPQPHDQKLTSLRRCVEFTHLKLTYYE